MSNDSVVVKYALGKEIEYFFVTITIKYLLENNNKRIIAANLNLHWCYLVKMCESVPSPAKYCSFLKIY